MSKSHYEDVSLSQQCKCTILDITLTVTNECGFIINVVTKPLLEGQEDQRNMGKSSQL